MTIPLNKPTTHGGARPGSGAPRTLPLGNRVQTYRGTDEEHAAVLAMLRKMRAKARKESAK